MRCVAFISCLFFELIVYSQIKIGNNLISDVEKNIIMYRIKNLDLNYACSYSKPLNFDRFLPSKNQVLDFSILAENLESYNPNITLFSVKTKYFFLKEQNLKNGRKSYSEIKFYASDGVTIDNIFLIGFNKKEKRIIYISGNFFKNCIADDFNLNKNDPESFKYFLKLKLFNYNIDKISFQKKKKKYLLFKAYSDELRGYIYVKVNPNNFDMLQVKSINGNWTEKGNYNWRKKW